MTQLNVIDLQSHLKSATATAATGLLAVSLDVTRKPRPFDDTRGLIGNALFAAFQAVAAEAITAGIPDDQIDQTLAMTLGWLMASGPEFLAFPGGSDGARRIDRFVRTALKASELAGQALDVGAMAQERLG